jgi:hypothetical protein
MRKRLAPSLLFLLCVWAGQAHAQLPVTDGGNLVQNTLQVAQMVISVANQALELSKLGSIAIAVDMADDMEQLLVIIQDARGLIADVGSLQVLFDPSPYTIPKTLPAMRERANAMNEAIKNARIYALKAQRLVMLLQSLTRHVTKLVGDISAIIGNKQGNQSLLQQEALMNKSLAILTTQAASQQRTDTLERMREAVIVAMDREIRRQYWLPYFDIGLE